MEIDLESNGCESRSGKRDNKYICYYMISVKILIVTMMMVMWH